MESQACQIRGLYKCYGDVMANAGIDLNIFDGEILGVFGPNGAGKTTMVKQLMGLTRPSKGDILLYGQNVVKNPEICPEFCAYYSQNMARLWAFRARELVYVTGRLRGLNHQTATTQTAELIDRFNLGALADRVMSALSGGQKRLVAFLASMVGYRPMLILDEPTNELDPSIRSEVWSLLREVNRQKGTTVILVTHNVIEAEQVVDRVAIVDKGRVVALGTPGELKRQVSDTVRVEIHLKPGADTSYVAALDGVRSDGRGTWVIQTNRVEVAPMFSAALDTLGSECIDDFRVVTPSMQDVYVLITGRGWAEA